MRGVMDAAVALHPENPSQQSRHRVRSARPWGVNLAEFCLVTFKKNGKKIRLVEKYCNMQITEKIDYSVGQIHE
jgi:hypothetical protein